MIRCFDRPWYPDVFCEECGSPITYDEDWQCLVCKDKEEEYGEFLGFKSYPFKTREEYIEDTEEA